MSALASDIENERRPYPSQTSLSYRPTSNSYGYSSTTNNLSWMPQQQQQQQQQQYQQYQEKQQRYPQPFSKIFSFHLINKNLNLDGSSPQQMWNGNNQQQYVSQNPTRLDFSNQIQPPQQQRLPSRQSSQYSSNSTMPTNNCKIFK